MSTRNFYPDVFPGTRIDFSNSTMLPNSLEFGRASTGTYTDQNGIIRTAIPGEPRFTYDVATGESLGLLVEEVGTNEMTVSIPTATSPWTVSSLTSVITNAATAPDGSYTATLVAADDGNTGNAYVRANFTAIPTKCTFSFFAKDNGVGECSGLINTTNGQWVFTYNFSTGATSYSGIYVQEIKVVNLPNGWRRVSISISGTSTSWVLMNARTSWGGTHPNGNSSTGVYFWGVQAETGSFPTSYIPTSGSTVTRAADTFSAPVGSFKSSRIIFSPAIASNSVSLPTLKFSDSTGPTPPYSLELSTPSLIPTLTTKYNSVPQSYLSIPTAPAPSSPPPEQCSIAFNYNSATGAMGLATSAGDDASTTAVVLPEEYNIPAPAGYALDTVSVSGGGGAIKEIYTWNTELNADQLASVAKEFKAVGRPAFTSSGLQDDTLYDVAGGRPTLDLNFAKNKNLVNSVNDLSLVSFSRASKGTYVDEDGIIQEAVTDEPRFDHDPDTLDSLGLLVEEERTNLMKYSQDISTLTYTNTQGLSAIIPNSIIAPNGSITASKLVVDSQNNLHRVIPNVGTISGGHTLSVFAKAAEYTHAWLYIFGDGLYRGVTFDLSNGTVSGNYHNLATNIIPLNNGWYRLSIYYPNASNAGFGPADQGYSIQNTLIFQGDGTSGVYFWGAQLEEGTFPTSYIPTPATFISRASSATYYDSNGIIQTALADVARDDAYFPDENGIFRPAGLLLEAQGTNLLTYSEEFDFISWWSRTGVNVNANTTSAPDGNVTADLLTEDSSTGLHQLETSNNVYNAVIGTSYTYSVYVKPNGRTEIGLGYRDSGLTIFNLSTKQITVVGQLNSGGSITNNKIESFPNGWYRISSTIVDQTNYNRRAEVFLCNGGSNSYAGDGSSGAYIWGYQIETSPYPTSYIPTSGSQGIRQPDISSSAEVIRRDDVAEITGTNFSSLYNGDFGTFFIDMKRPPYYTSGSFMEIFDNAGPFLWDAGNTFFVRIGAENNYYTLGTYTTEEDYKIAISYLSATSYSASSNGSVPTPLATAIDFTNATEWHIGRGNNSFTANWRNGSTTAHWKRLTYWPTRLPDTSLQTITNPAIETWDLVFDSSLSSNGKCAIITNGTCEYNVDWGDGTPTQTISASGTFTAAHTYVVPKKYNVRIEVVSGAFRPYYNNSLYADQLIEIGPSPDTWSNTSTSGFGTNINAAWYGANNLRVVDRELNTSGITNFSFAWLYCSSLTSFPLIDTSSGTTFGSAWERCSSLTSFPLINTSAALSLGATWYYCSSLTSFPPIDTSNVTSLSLTWGGCSSLASFPLLDTSSCTDFNRTWNGCGFTSFPPINTANGTNFSVTWGFNPNLTSFPQIDFSSGTNFFAAWLSCPNLTTFPANMFDTTGILVSTAFTQAFQSCAFSAQSIENILVSLDTNGQSGITLGINGGTNASNYDWTAGAWGSFNNLVSKSWTISYNDNLFASSPLDLQFATTKTLDSRITFSRGSTGTYVDSNGIIQTAAADTPRFDHDPNTLESLGLLVEEQRTNFLTNSEHLDIGWIYQSSTILPTTTSVEAPDGGLDARLFTGAGDRIRQDTTPSAGAVVYTLSVYYKPNTDTTLQLWLFNNGSQANVTFDTTNPNNPTITTGSGFMVDAGNGWFRASVTTSAATDGGVIESMIYTDSGYLWGAQLEEGAFPTSYIPTSGSTVTRNADEASITGTNFSSWYNATAGSFYVQEDSRNNALEKYYIFISDGANNDRLWLSKDSVNRHVFRVYDSANILQVVSVSPNLPSSSELVSSKFVGSYSSGDSNSALNGSISGTTINNTFIRSGSNSAYLGRSGSGSYLNSHISRLTYWPKRLPDGALQFLTS